MQTGKFSCSNLEGGLSILSLSPRSLYSFRLSHEPVPVRLYFSNPSFRSGHAPAAAGCVLRSGKVTSRFQIASHTTHAIPSCAQSLIMPYFIVDVSHSSYMDGLARATAVTGSRPQHNATVTSTSFGSLGLPDEHMICKKRLSLGLTITSCCYPTCVFLVSASLI